MSSRSAPRYLILALIAAAALRLGALAVPIDPFAAPDSESFVLLSQSIVHEGRMAYRDPGSPAIELRAFRSLFYPLFLAAFECVHAGTTGALIVQRCSQSPWWPACFSSRGACSATKSLP